eukprot:6272995-Pyramimonas_sp.AAC.1
MERARRESRRGAWFTKRTGGESRQRVQDEVARVGRDDGRQLPEADLPGRAVKPAVHQHAVDLLVLTRVNRAHPHSRARPPDYAPPDPAALPSFF